MREAIRGHLLPPSGDNHATAYKVHFSDPEISKARHYPPLAKTPDREQATRLEILRRRVMEYWVEMAERIMQQQTVSLPDPSKKELLHILLEPSIERYGSLRSTFDLGPDRLVETSPCC
jgi:hypothetical protein